jgi:hypothetical protein
MAATGFTPIQLYRTSTASAVPLAANLAAGELAINTADVALFAENASGTVTRIMNNPAGLVYPTADGTSGQLLTTNGSGTISFAANALLTSAGYLEAVYSDEVVALGNSGTATSIDLRQGNVFTATLTGNCTFTLTNSNANSNRGSSFTLILTNDATAGRTVAWAGGAFRFPGGASTLSRTTTANAVDIWVFFTPDNGTTYYGNISMKNLLA